MTNYRNDITRFGGKNALAVKKSTGRVFYSYSTPVAVEVGSKLYVTEQKYSPTTSKHIGLFKKESGGEVVSVAQDVIDKLAGV